MKRKNKVFALILGALFSLGLLAGCDQNNANTGNNGNPGNTQQGGNQQGGNQQGGQQGGGVVSPADDKVYFVLLQYEKKNIEDSLTADISLGAIQLTAIVSKGDDSKATLAYTSDNEEVATVDDNGLVTLKKAGKTAITATIADKSQKFDLTVGDEASAKDYPITINGGIAKDSVGDPITAAKPGTWVTLEATGDLDHYNFNGWTFDTDDVKLNGAMFRMPKHDVTVTADISAKVYSLQLVGATVEQAGTVTAPEGADKGYTQDGTTDEYKITEYQIAYGTQVTVKAIDAPEGKMFVGWDCGAENNRVGETGIERYTFDMGESTRYWAVFTELTKNVMTSNGPLPFSDANRGWKKITDGAPAGEETVEEYRGLNGLRFAIPGNTTMDQTIHEQNVGRLGIDNITAGSHHGAYTLQIILHNLSDKYTVVLEMEAEYNGLMFSTGNIEVGPGKTVRAFRQMEIGFQRPDGGVHVRNNIGGNSDETVLVDMLVGAAPTNPGVDGRFTPNGIPEYVNLAQTPVQDGVPRWGVNSEWGVATGGGWTSWRPSFHDNAYGISTILYPGSPSKNAFLEQKIINLPEKDVESGMTTVYVKIINLYAFSSVYGGKDLDLVFSTNKDPAQNTIRKSISLAPGVETLLLKFELPRTSAGDEYYVAVVNTLIQGNLGFCMQMTYNNVFGYTDSAEA